MEFEVTENGQSARLRDFRPRSANSPLRGLRTVSTFMSIDDSWVLVLGCDIYHFSSKLPIGLEGFGRFLAGVLAAQPPVSTMGQRELVIAAWNSRSLGRWLC